MPRKKRTRRRDVDDDGGAFSNTRRHAENEEPLVISDSENEEENYKPTAREGRLRARESTASARELTEDEMVEMAVRLSEQEAALRQRREEEDMQKAIAQSLHVRLTPFSSEANGMQTNSDDCESLPLVMTPVGGSQPSPGQSPSPAAESPVFPPRQKPCSLSLSKRKSSVSTDDHFTTATNVGGAQARKLGNLCSQPAVPPESPPPGTDAPVPAVPAPEEVDGSQGGAPGAGPEWGSQGRCSEGGGSPGSWRSSSQPVLRIARLSQALEQDCLSAGFVVCSQRDAAEVPGSSPPSPQLSPAPPRSPTFPRGPTGLRKSPEAAHAAPEPAGREQTSPSAPPSKAQRSERTPRSRLKLSKNKDASCNHGDADWAPQCGGSVGGASCQPALGVQEPLEPDLFFPTQMTLHWSDDEDEEEGEEEGEGPGKKEERPAVAQTPSPPVSQHAVCEQGGDSQSLLRGVAGPARSPVFTRDACSPVGRARSARRKFTFQSMYAVPPAGAPRAAPSLQAQVQAQATPPEGRGRGRVLYYWGVPFCPRGRDPDEYTQVILSQLEVYEKSLKGAQRGLLHKASWGEPVLPGPPKPPLCRRARLKRPRPARPLANEEEEEAEVEEEEEELGATAVEEEQRGSQDSEEGRGGCEAQESQPSEGPPKTLLEQESPLHIVPEEPPEKITFLRRGLLRERSPAESETQLLVDQEEEEEEEEEGMCPETPLSEQNPLDVNMESPAESQLRPESEVMETQEETQVELPEEVEAVGGEAAMEVEVAEAEVRREAVECPICMRSFPLADIEMHAAYCDGAAQPSAPEESASQVTARRTRTRRTEAIHEERPGCSRTTKEPAQEKCFLCQGLFPVREYQRHVEACILQKSTSTNPGAKNLLTALDRSEQRDREAGPSHSSFRKKESSRSATLTDADQSGESADVAFPISSSPIRAFTPISEVTDCLIDFKRQYPSKPSQRAGRKRKFHR